MTNAKSIADVKPKEWVDFQIKVAVDLYNEGFSDFMFGQNSNDTSISYISGYKDAKKIYG